MSKESRAAEGLDESSSRSAVGAGFAAAGNIESETMTETTRSFPLVYFQL